MARAWCKHYRGMHERETCEAGVRFRELPGYGDKGFMDACPCFGPDPTGRCSQAEYPTEAELAAEEAEMQTRIANTLTARAAIVEHLGGPWKRGMPSVAARMDCPICGTADALQFSRAGYNGHIHAQCQTDGCVGWIE